MNRRAPKLRTQAEGKPSKDAEAFVWGFEDETRARILRLIAEKEPIGASQVADELGLPKPRVSRIVGKMREKGLLEQVGVRPRRGALERLFRGTNLSTWLSNEDWYALPPSKKKRLFLAVIRPLLSNVSAIADSADDLRPDCWCGTSTRTVDRQGWTELVDIYSRSFREVHRVFQESGERLSEAPEDGIRTSSSLFLFNLPTDASEEPSDRHKLS